MTDAINGDLNARACEDTRSMEWSPSPSGSVWRKRVHRVGPVESGQVTSVVRYEPGATFPAHDHPGGEEILVLDGVFSDEHGDWPAGTYLLNPDGFRHAPFSECGCLLWVKLRQYPGKDRTHVVQDTYSARWATGGDPRRALLPLYQQAGFRDSMRLERWAPGTDRGLIRYSRGVEIFALDGSFQDDAGRYRTGAWLRLPPGDAHRPRTDDGCTLYVKEGGFAYLQPATG